MRSLLLPVLTVPCLFSQSTPIFEGSVTRTLNVAPTEAILFIRAAAQPGTTLEQVISALQPAGVREADLTGRESLWQHYNLPETGGLIGSLRFPPSEIFQFRIERTAEEAGTVANALDALRQRLPAILLSRPLLDSALSYSIGFRASVEPALAARRAVLPEVFQQAQARAAAMAAASGTAPGTVLSIQENLVIGESVSLSVRVRSGPHSPFQPRTAQLNINSVLPPILDEAVISIQLTADRTVPRAEVVQLAAQAGFGERELVRISQQSFDLQSQQIDYQFMITRPAREGELLVQRLRALLRDRPGRFPIAAVNMGLTTSAAQRAEAFRRVLPDLVAQARLRAEDYARLTGGRLGAVRSVADGPPPIPSNVIPAARIVPIIVLPGLPNQESTQTIVEFAIE
jgi:uncharacterized protein YggE